MEKYLRSSQPHQNAKTIKVHKSDICENKNRKTLQIKSRKQNHYHKHHSDDNDSHDLSTTEDSVFSDHHHDNRHHHSHWSKRKQSHRSLSTSSTSITSSSSPSSSSSSTSSSPSTSSLSSSFSSSTTSSSSSSFSSDTDSESSHPWSKPQHSRSCTDISSKNKYFDKGDDTAPLIAEGEHLTQKPKQERVRSSQCAPSHRGHKITRGDGSVRKAKSMESLARPKEKEAQDETEQERRKNEARKNLVKEKMKFSAFLNEITRQVLSPMRLTTLGVSDAQRSSSPGQVSVRSKKSENNTEKKEQQTNLPRSADSASSGRYSRSNRRSKRSNSHHRHYSHRSADSPDHKPRSCPDTGCFKRHHSWSYRHRSCSPSDKHHHQEHHCYHHGHDSPSYQRDHQHKYEHYRSPTCYQDDHHKISHHHKKHHYHYSENHQSTPHHHTEHNAPAHHNHQCPAHHHGSCHTSHHCNNGNNHQGHSSHSNERPTTPHHHRPHNDPGDYCTDSYNQHHHGDHHSQHRNHSNHHCKHHNHGHHRNVPHHQHREHHHQREHHYGGHYPHEDHHDNPYYHGNHQSESYHHHGDHQTMSQDHHHEPHPHHCKLNHLNEHHHHGDHHSESHHHDGDHHTDPKNHHGDHHSESHHHHGEHHAGHQQHHEGHYSPHIGPKSHQIQSKTNQGHTGQVYHCQSLNKVLESSKDSTRNASTSSQDEDQTSFTNSLCKENAHDIGRIMILQEQNEGLQQTLLKTAVRVECLGEEFMSSRKCLEAELQRTRMELSNLTERFKRLHDNCSSTQQTNSLLQQKLHLVAQNMEGERERLNKRISALTETLADTKFTNSMETCNVTSMHKSNHHFHSEEVINQVVLPITPPPAQFMDYAKDKAAGQEQSLGSVPEEEESDWSEIGEETPRFILTGLNRGQAWRHTESEVDKDSESGGEEIVRPHSPRPLTIPHLHFTVHNEMSPFTQTNLSNIGICEGSYKITTNPKLGSSVLVRSASLEEIPLARHSMQKELRGTEAMMDLHRPCAEANEDYNEIIHHLGTSNNRDTVNGWQIDSNVSEMDRAMSGLQSAERILNHIISETQQSQQMGEAKAEMHGWTGGIPDEVLKGERTKL